MLVLKARTKIHASARHVFDVITDFESYAEWNPWIGSIEGSAEQGSEVIIKPKAHTMVGYLKLKITENEAPELLRWREVDWFRFAAYVERERLIYPAADGAVIYTSRLYIMGPLAKAAGIFYRSVVQRGMMNEAVALKKYCEAKYSESDSHQESAYDTPFQAIA